MHPSHPRPGPQSSDESTPLLSSEYADLEAAKRKTPLPKGQLAALCISRLADPIAYCQLFPYINQMLFDLHVTDDISKVGFYSGLVESIFAVSQTLTSYHWAKASDIIGRRPIVLAGAIGLALVTLLLGFCTSLTEIILVRALAGFLAGNVAVFHAILAEITDSSNSPKAYSLYAVTWPLGSTIGPLIGGSFSNLGTKYPDYWKYDFILSHPYFMPNLVCALLVVVGLCLSYTYLEETLPSKRHKPCIDDTVVTQQSPRLGAMDLLSIPMVRALTVSGFTLAFIGTAYDVVFVLFCYTPIERGGLSFSITQIGHALALNGVILIILQLLFVPTLLRTYRTSVLYHTSTCCWPLTFFVTPFLNFIVRAGYDAGNEAGVDPATSVILWIGIALVLTCSRIAALAFTTNMILIRNHSPSPAYLGACSGLVQVAMCVSRMFSPAFISSVFALSVGNNLLGGYPIWVVVMLSVCLVGCYFSQKMVAIDKKLDT
ncbi:MFS domain-containing protein [Mycena venus]|uniref:MFS domain-containing protein n=1 Tax=Mycena venus TaxID=2733690 RepID=A0A8H6XDE7_9AGAR|nr:MFS domain-containing protein [Mycena venus]